MTATAPLVIVVMVQVVAMLLGTAFNSDELIGDTFGSLTAPSSLLDMPLFVFDFSLAFLQIVFAMLTWDYGFPTNLRFILATVCNTILVVSVIAIFK